MNISKLFALIIFTSTAALFGADEAAVAASSTGQELKNPIYSLQTLALIAIRPEHRHGIEFPRSVLQQAFDQAINEFENDPKYQNKQNGNDWLHYAAEHGHMPILQAHINSNQNLDATDKNEIRALDYAIQEKHQEIAIALINAGAKIDYSWANPLLIRVVRFELYDVEAALLANKVDINFRNPYESCALHHMVGRYTGTSNITEKIHSLISAGAVIDPQNMYGLTPLMIAAKEGRIEAVQILLDLGANPNIKDYAGKTASKHAKEAHQNKKEILALIKEAKKQKIKCSIQ